jgi:hypothetical protein
MKTFIKDNLKVFDKVFSRSGTERKTIDPNKWVPQSEVYKNNVKKLFEPKERNARKSHK